MADEKSTNKALPEKKDKTELRIHKLVLVIGNDTPTRKEIMAALKLGGRRNFMDRYQHPGTAQGYIEMLFPKSPSAPEQAYRLTDKGLELYESLNKSDKVSDSL